MSDVSCQHTTTRLSVSFGSVVFQKHNLEMNENRKKAIIGSVLLASKRLFGTLQENDGVSDDEESNTSVVLNEVIALVNSQLNPRKNKILRIEGFFEDAIERHTLSQFRSHFRLSKDAYTVLCDKIIPILNQRGQRTTGRPLTNPAKKILAFLWLLVTPDSYRSVGEKFNLGKASLADDFDRIIQALNEIAPDVIKWPSAQDRPELSRKFISFAAMDGVIGAIDGTFIPIKAPKEDAAVYVTRKCNHAMTLQAIGDSSLQFIDAFIAYPGSVNDGRIFKNSDIYKKDKAYPLLDWCTPPYIDRGRLTAIETYFNTVHAKTRQVMERIFALLFGRFRRLKYLDMSRTDLIPQTVIAACVLHNLCLNYESLLQGDVEKSINEGNDFLLNNNNRVQEADLLNDNARRFRDNLAETMFNNRNRN